MMEMRKMRWDRRWLAVLLFAGAVPVLGCTPEPKYVKAEGTVKYDDGTDLKAATVRFLPATGNDFKGGTPSGVVTDGKYKIMTGSKEGVPVGKWDVVITSGSASMGAPTTAQVGATGAPAMGGPMGDAPQIAPKFGDQSQTPYKNIEVKDGMSPDLLKLTVTKT